MLDESSTSRTVRVWEQHGQTLIMTIMAASLFYFANATIDAKEAQATTAAELKAVNANLSRLEGAVNAMQLQYVYRGEFTSLEARVIRLETTK